MEGLPNPEENLLIEREILESYINRIVTADPDTPDLLAHLFVKFKRAIESDLQPVSQICETLNVAIQLTYLQTKAHAVALKLYILYQRGELLIQDYPVELMSAAIERAKVGDESEHETDNASKEELDSQE